MTIGQAIELRWESYELADDSFLNLIDRSMVL